MAQRATFQLPNSQKPLQGPVGISVPFDFTTRDTVAGDLALEQMSGSIEFVQAIFIDNRLNTKPFTITFNGLQYTIQVKAGRQGIFPVLCAIGVCSFSATSPAAALIVPTIMFNVQQPYFTWDI